MNTRMLLLLLILSPLLAWNQSRAVQLTCRVSGCSGPLKLFRFTGLQFEELQSARVEGEHTYRFELEPSAEPDFYYVGPASDQAAPVLLGPEAELELEGNCRSMRRATVKGSALNTGYRILRDKINRFKSEYNRNAQLLRGAPEGEQREELLARIKALDEAQLAYLDSLEKADPFFAGIMSLNTYLSYEHNKGGHANGLVYFANEFFTHADFDAPGMARSPWLFESFRNYTKTLAAYKFPDAQMQRVVGIFLNRVPDEGLARRLAMGGVLTALKETNHPSYTAFAEQYIQHFRKEDPRAAAALEKEVKQMQALHMGGQAPDFTQKTPEGEALSLSDLRGQVVLLDFWASWCGPCRRENPHVKKLYERYKSEGFTVLGVSLDKNRDRWLAAIEKDGLDWHHVSDLRGWSNTVARQYGVRSIPHTFLLDREGKIIGAKLRGAALEKKLKKLFGTP
jgi:peroxiredoxin